VNLVKQHLSFSSKTMSRLHQYRVIDRIDRRTVATCLAVCPVDMYLEIDHAHITISCFPRDTQGIFLDRLTGSDFDSRGCANYLLVFTCATAYAFGGHCLGIAIVTAIGNCGRR
jgi:hypothetical protein